MVSVTSGTPLRYRALDEVGADSVQSARTADLELPVGLATPRIEAVERDRELFGQLSDRKGDVPIGMDQLAVRSEARCGPAVLVVHTALTRVELACRSIERPFAERPDVADQRAGGLDGRCLIGGANLQGPEAWMQADVPPEARVVTRHAGLGHPLDEPLPLGVVAEGGRRTVSRQQPQHLCTNREHAGVPAFEVRGVR